MVKVELYENDVKIPFILSDFRITYEGVLTEAGQVTGLKRFNDVTGLLIPDISVLSLVTFHRLKLPPIYWKSIKVLRHVDRYNSPENLLAGFERPVESFEYPGFFLIPYFSNYVISPCGILIKKSTGEVIMASETQLGYYTFRMTGDDGRTRNQLRHRILCFAFKPYPANVEELDVNHINGIPGDDWLDNLEWATRSENMLHAFANGLRSDNKPVEVKDVRNNRYYVFDSCSGAARALGVTETTISNRAKTNGHKSFDGMQFRFHPSEIPWPTINSDVGNYLVEFEDGTTKKCSSKEAAVCLGVTRTSLMRLLREGRSVGPNGNKVSKILI